MLTIVKNIRTVIVTAAVLLPGLAAANLLTSPHFRLDPNVAASFGGSSGSPSYTLADAGGEAAVGAASSQSYKLGEGYAASLPHSLQLSVMATGTYGYWPMDTGTGTQAYDVSQNSDDATLVAAPSWAAGIINQGITLNGTTQYLATSKSVSSPTPYTIEIWFKTNTVAGGRIMGFGDAQTGASTNRDRQIYMDNAGHVIYGTKAGAPYKTISTTSSYNDNSWHHVAASLGASGLLLYVDGTVQATDPTTTTAGSYSGYWRMGYDDLTGWPSAPTSSFFAGTIDEAHVISRQISAAEVLNDFTSGSGAIQNAFTLPNITPGQSQVYNVDAVVRTDAGGYDMYIQRPTPLKHTDNVTTIPDIAGTIASPAAWVEGTTKGFGFAVIGGVGVEAKWGTTPNFNYGALPAAATVYHSRTGLTTGVPEVTTIRYRVDTDTVQKNGTYSTTVIYTATAKP